MNTMHVDECGMLTTQSIRLWSSKVWYQWTPGNTKNTIMHSIRSSGTTTLPDLPLPKCMQWRICWRHDKQGPRWPGSEDELYECPRSCAWSRAEQSDDQRMNLSRTLMPSIWGYSIYYDLLLLAMKRPSKSIEPIPSKTIGLTILHPPHMILNQSSFLDHTRHCTVSYRSYVHANQYMPITKLWRLIWTSQQFVCYLSASSIEPTRRTWTYGPQY